MGSAVVPTGRVASAGSSSSRRHSFCVRQERPSLRRRPPIERDRDTRSRPSARARRRSRPASAPSQPSTGRPSTRRDRSSTATHSAPSSALSSPFATLRCGLASFSARGDTRRGWVREPARSPMRVRPEWSSRAARRAVSTAPARQPLRSSEPEREPTWNTRRGRGTGPTGPSSMRWRPRSHGSWTATLVSFQGEAHRGGDRHSQRMSSRSRCCHEAALRRGCCSELRNASWLAAVARALVNIVRAETSRTQLGRACPLLELNQFPVRLPRRRDSVHQHQLCRVRPAAAPG
jgi:hypothetical protein